MTRPPLVHCSSPFVELSHAELAAFCERWMIDEFRLVGSAASAQSRFHADSDLDFVFFASFRAKIYAPDGGVRREAIAELRRLCFDRDVDFVCARKLAQSGNPFAVHNLLVANDYDRTVGLLWYLRQVAVVFVRAVDVAARLASPVTRHQMLNVFATLGRTCETSARIDEWKRLGLPGPWEEVRLAMAPALVAIRQREEPVWPSDEVLTGLASAVVAQARSIANVAERVLPPPPPISDALIVHALGDLPRAGSHPPNIPALNLDERRARGSALQQDLVELCARWGVRRLVERIDETSVSAPIAYAFAATDAPLYRGPGEIEPEALSAFARLGIAVECIRRVVVTANPLLVYNALVRVSFSDDAIEEWFRGADAPTINVPAALVLEAVGNMPPAERAHWQPRARYDAGPRAPRNPSAFA